MLKHFLVALLFFVAVAKAQFTGSYNVGTGETYTTLKSLFDAINAGTVDGNITINITSDLTEASNVGLGVNTNGFSITIRPSADVDRTITFTQLADNTSPTGHLVIGYVGTGLTSAYSDANTVATNNVTIDGYASGGSTRRLIFTNTAANHVGARVIVVVGACQNTVIKNVTINNLTTSTTSPFCIGAVVRVGASEWAPTNLTIENNVLTATGGNVSMGSRITNSGTVTTAKVSGFVFKKNIVTAKRRLLEINYTNGGEIYDNEFTTAASSAAPGSVSYGLWTATGVTGTFNIYNNKFLASTSVETGAFGHRAISLASGATCNVYNNMFSGMNKTSASTVATNLTYLFYGATGVIYHNTFYMPALTNATSTGYYSSIQLSSANPTIKNNIFISDEAAHANPYFINSVTTSESNYNNFYVRVVNASHKFVSTNTSFAAYQAANPTKDAQSKSKNVTFVSASDLHLNDSYKTTADYELASTPIGTVTTDIDGHARHASYPYMGADEILEQVLPVELTSFTASVKGKNVELRWNTASETNNHGFEIERTRGQRTEVGGQKSDGWSKIGFVQGAGNSNAPKSYGYTDAVTDDGRYTYRLKQIDNDGRISYHTAIEVNIVTAEVSSYELAQNFPNPFNPVTTIRFSVKQMEQASVKVYDITGKEVAELFNGIASPGQIYNVQFNGSGLASGMYLYVLQTPSAREVRKMSMIK